MLTRELWIVLLVGFGALLSTDCTACPEPAASGKTHTVLIRRSSFEPARLEVAAGDTVLWKNEDIVTHTATAKGTFDSRNVRPEQSWSYTTSEKGSFPYICTLHPTMQGVLVVR